MNYTNIVLKWETETHCFCDWSSVSHKVPLTNFKCLKYLFIRTYKNALFCHFSLLWNSLGLFLEHLHKEYQLDSVELILIKEEHGCLTVFDFAMGCLEVIHWLMLLQIIINHNYHDFLQMFLIIEIFHTSEVKSSIFSLLHFYAMIAWATKFPWKELEISCSRRLYSFLETPHLPTQLGIDTTLWVCHFVKNVLLIVLHWSHHWLVLLKRRFPLSEILIAEQFFFSWNIYLLFSSPSIIYSSSELTDASDFSFILVFPQFGPELMNNFLLYILIYFHVLVSLTKSTWPTVITFSIGTIFSKC